MGCADGVSSAPAHPGGVTHVGASGLLAQTGTAPRPIPAPARPPAFAGVVVEQPEGAAPRIEFVGPRPPELPFRMDFSSPTEPPAVIELSLVKFGEATQARLRRLLQVEMAKYPTGVLGSVSSIYVGGTLTYNRQAVGGFQFVGLVFIAAGECDAGGGGGGAATDAPVARAFHHEVSHALMDAHRATFDAARFRAALPPGFAYADDRPGAVEEGPLGAGGDSPSLDLLDEGFLVPWARRSVDEDFSSYAEILMRKPGLLLDTFAPESRVGRKARVVRDFYVAIDPRFASMLNPDSGSSGERK